jgi:hypothetical protein
MPELKLIGLTGLFFLQFPERNGTRLTYATEEDDSEFAQR